jgi:hypothetical protein
MNDVRSILITALTSSLATATGRKVYGQMPIHLEGTKVFPHIEISDISIQEDGQKNNFQYTVNVLLEIWHKNLASLSTLYNDMNNVKGIINNAVPFALTGGYSIMDCRLVVDNTTQASKEKDNFDIGLIRLIFRIK